MTDAGATPTDSEANRTDSDATTTDTDAGDPNVLVAGETLVDFLPESPGPLADVETFSRRAGGAPANVAVALARLGETPWFWTRVGEDPFGDHLAATLREFGVPNRFVERDSDAKTALAFVSHDASADRSFTFYRDGTADTRLEPGGISDDLLDAVEWVALGGVMLASEPGRTATFDLAERAASHDCTVVFDPNARPELWGDGGEAEEEHDEGTNGTGFADSVAEMFEFADVVKATPEDLATAGIEAEAPEALAEAVTRFGPHTVLLTLGESGAFAYATDEAPWGSAAASHGGYGVDPVDTTGAGDAFLAGALAAFARDALDADEPAELSLSEVLGFANAVAAITTSAPGAMAALPTREEVRTFLD